MPENWTHEDVNLWLVQIEARGGNPVPLRKQYRDADHGLYLAGEAMDHDAEEGAKERMAKSVEVIWNERKRLMAQT